MRVLLADDHRMMREGLRAVLERAGIEVVGEAADGRQVIVETRRIRPDVVVMDIAMPKVNGVDATRELKKTMPDVTVIALSMNADQCYVIAMLEAGAKGYLLKSAASEELLTALRVVKSGETYVSPAIVGVVVGHAVQAGRPPSSVPEKPLSSREREVLQLVADGKSSKEIATTLGIAVPTVETHRRQIMSKLNLRTIAELTKYAIRAGLTSAER